MRALLLIATLAAFSSSSVAQTGFVPEPTSAPEASGESVVVVAPEAAPAEPFATPPERNVAQAAPKNIVLGVLGGEGLSAGIGYERRLAGPLFARTGFQYYNNGVDISGRFVPLSVGGVARLGGRWSADASAGATLMFMHNEGQDIPLIGYEGEPFDYLIMRGVGGLGVRYETDRLHLRGGAAFLPMMVPDQNPQEPGQRRLFVLPWPSLSVGYRF